MISRLKIETRTKADAHAIERALTDPVVYAFVVIMGTLAELETPRARARVLAYVRDVYDEHHEGA